MKWTDDLVIEFARATTQGGYGDYYGCKSIHSKLQRFKELHPEKEPRMKDTSDHDHLIEYLTNKINLSRIESRMVDAALNEITDFYEDEELTKEQRANVEVEIRKYVFDNVNP